MNSLDTEFGRRLQKRLEEARVQQAGHILSGMMEHPDYKLAAGYWKALNDVATWCDEIDQQMRQGK